MENVENMEYILYKSMKYAISHLLAGFYPRKNSKKDTLSPKMAKLPKIQFSHKVVHKYLLNGDKIIWDTIL